LKTRMSWQTEQINIIEQQLAKSLEEKKKIAEEEEDLKEKVNTKKLENDVIFNQLKDIPLEDLQEELFVCNANKAMEEQAVNNLNLRINEISGQIKSMTSEKEKNTIKSVETDNNLKELHTNYQTLLSREKEIESNLSGLTERITPTEKDLNESELQDQKLQLEQEQARQQFSVVERHSIQAQMKFSRVREQQENLTRRIEEDFGLVFYEYGQSVDGPTPLPIEGMVESLPKLTQVPDELEENIKQKKSIIRRMGPINPEAQKEYKEVQERHQFITEQLKDLDKAEGDLRQVVKELDELMKTEFQKTFKKVNEVFKEIFEKLFDGGSANLIIADEENLTESGIDIEATLPGKRKQELASLSGGERSLTAVALIFALLKVSPTPFCILDEVDAMLDESNVMRFGDLLRELSLTTQFIVITHNRNTVQLANVLYGVTMGKDSTSQVISLKLDELTEDLVQ
jgi:chromosome segregation protein